MSEATALRTPANLLGLAVLGVAAGAALMQLVRAADSSRARPATTLPAPATLTASRTLHAAAALLATSVLADSALEHYRGEFKNPGMYTPLLTSLLTVLASACAFASRSGRSVFTRNSVYAMATAVGGAGWAFHVYNILRRPGGLRWLNLFYAAPLGAPMALSLAGLIGFAAQRLRLSSTLLKRPAHRVLSVLTSLGLLGTTAEAGLLHFRGAFQNPFMWVPVTVPPVAAAFMADAALRPLDAARNRLAHLWLRLTALLGIVGCGFHAYGIARQMGGWRNWSQNLLSGPPLPAPPSFSALALAGLAALSLAKHNHERQA